MGIYVGKAPEVSLEEPKDFKRMREDRAAEDERACPGGGRLIRGLNGPFCAYPPKRPKRIRMDWFEFGKALLLTAGALFAVLLPIVLMYSDDPKLEIVGKALLTIEFLLVIAYGSGILEFK